MFVRSNDIYLVMTNFLWCNKLERGSEIFAIGRCFLPHKQALLLLMEIVMYIKLYMNLDTLKESHLILSLLDFFLLYSTYVYVNVEMFFSHNNKKNAIFCVICTRNQIPFLHCYRYYTFPIRLDRLCISYWLSLVQIKKTGLGTLRNKIKSFIVNQIYTFNRRRTQHRQQNARRIL